MFAKLCVLLALFGIPVSSSLAQQAHSTESGLPHARIKCIDESYASVTADPERSLPLQVVAKAACNERVTIVSDAEGYTVRILTANGAAGYVTRYELTLEPAASPSPAPRPAPTATGGATNVAPAQSPGNPAADSATAAADKSKPRVFISDTQSWTESGGFTNSTGLIPGYNPEMADVYQDFTSDCQGISVVQDKSNADYAILFDHGSSKKGLTGLGGLVKVNKVTVLSRSGQTLASQSARSADAAVRLACSAVPQKPTTPAAH